MNISIRNGTGILVKKSLVPLLGILFFLVGWQFLSERIDTSLGQFPGPKHVLQQVSALHHETLEHDIKVQKFIERQRVRHEKKLIKNPSAKLKLRKYTGKPTYIEQVFTSIYTVLFGFFMATLIAIPLGILCGLNSAIFQACNPIIQLLKPVSPLAWLPLVTMLVSATFVSDTPMFEKAFLTSAFTVTLCCLWPTVINTTIGVASLDKDLVNVGRVIRLSPLTHITKIVLPSAIPMIFTGLRLSLATGWMVLIAAEMLAQNPGLGKFIWDEFQNGSSNSLSRIMVAVLTIGLIGFALDYLMLRLQKWVSWDKQALLR